VCLRRQTDTPPALHFVIVVCTRSSIIHVIQRLERGTCHHSRTTAGSRLSVQRPDPTDRWLTQLPVFLRHAPVSASTALRSASTPNRHTTSTPLRHRQHTGGFHASPCRPCGSHRWLNLQSFLVLLFRLPLGIFWGSTPHKHTIITTRRHRLQCVTTIRH